MKVFDPALHERVDDGDFSIGDQITLTHKHNHSFVWMGFYTIVRLEDDKMWPRDLGISIDRIRGPGSAMYYTRIKRTKEYDLDQVLDEDEDLL